MNKTTTILLQALLAIIGVGILGFMLRMPWLEGVNASATHFSQIYFDDPFLAYVYLGSIPFFVGLYRTIKALAKPTAQVLRKIKYCFFTTAAAILGAVIYLGVHARLYPEVGAVDGPEGALVLGGVSALTLVALALVARKFEKKFAK